MQAELRKAWRALKTAKINCEISDGAASVNRSYYAMYYAAKAMLLSVDADIPKTHSALIGEFSRRFVVDGPFLKQLGRNFNKIEEQRRYVDYIADEEIPIDTALDILDKATEFVQKIAVHLKIQPDIT